MTERHRKVVRSPWGTGKDRGPYADEMIPHLQEKAGDQRSLPFLRRFSSGNLGTDKFLILQNVIVAPNDQGYPHLE